MALSASLVETIFARMTVRYGAAWRAKWAGVPADAVKADWSHELAGFPVAAITHALLHLPEEYPPTVAQFKALCCRAPEPEQPRLPAPKADPARIAAVVAEVHAKWAQRKPLQWAYDLQERERLGDDLSITQRAAWRAVLQQQMDTTIVGAFSQIPEHLHPPGGLRAEP